MLSNAMRDMYQEYGNARIMLFYQDRFNANPDNVSRAFCQLVDGIDLGIINNFNVSIPLLKKLLA